MITNESQALEIFAVYSYTYQIILKQVHEY